MGKHDKEGREEMQNAIRLRQSRRETWEKEGERPLWRNLSMVGALGWLIVVPTLLGVLAGRWLDDVFDSGVTFSGALTFAGACLGFYLAWSRMNNE
jgi:ATP synthase protein I